MITLKDSEPDSESDCQTHTYTHAQQFKLIHKLRPNG